ncbi:MAG TPA: hypothetical protein VMS99_17875 [Acidimicrobiia bacterium]|nr:hypothetical protein [Acidimicrobiia bacterium]
MSARSAGFTDSNPFRTAAERALVSVTCNRRTEAGPNPAPAVQPAVGGLVGQEALDLDG